MLALPVPSPTRTWPWFFGGIACALLGFDLFYEREAWESAALVLAVPLVVAGASRRIGAAPRTALTLWALGAVAIPLARSAVWPLGENAPWAELLSPGAVGAGLLGLVAIAGVWRKRTWGLVAALGALVSIAFTTIPPILPSGTCQAYYHPLHDYRGAVLALLALASFPWMVPLVRAGLGLPQPVREAR